MKVPSLSPCPCCGGSASGRSELFEHYDRVRYYVACGRCEMRGPSQKSLASSNGDGPSCHAAAAQAWNSLASRAKPLPQAGRPIVLHGRAV